MPALLATLLLAFSPLIARGAVISVTTTADESGTGEACSLREALESANGNNSVGGCDAGDAELDVIEVPPGEYTLGAQGELVVFGGNTKIVGEEDDTTTIRQEGANRLLFASGATLEIEGITFTGGAKDSDGGAILATSSNVTMRDLTFTGNTGTFGGAFCQFNGTATIIDVDFVDNVATNNGGGIFSNTSTLTVNDCEIRGNEAQSGGGLYNSGGSTLNSTGTWFEGNEASSSGGGIYNAGQMTLTQALVEQNLAQSGAGLRNDGGIL